MLRPLLVAIVAFAGFWASPGHAQEWTATLTLDGLSFVSFGDRQVFQIPAGSTIRFRFAGTWDNDQTGFSIQPEDAALPPIPASELGGELLYKLTGPAKGTLRRASDGSASIEFAASVSVALDDGEAETPATNVYALRFTTDHAQADDALGGADIAVDGVKVVPKVNYVQIVAGTTNRENSVVEPQAAVYTVLSGTFDRLPGQ